MPYTLNGFGTRYYGRREPGEDGSYVTTLWITALYIPVLPLGSYRVLPIGQGTNYVVHSSQSYRVLRVPLCWEQVWRIYMVGAPILIIVGWLIASISKEDRLKESLHGRLSAAGSAINTAHLAALEAKDPCLAWFNSPETPNKKLATLSLELHDRCTTWAPAEDAYIANIDRYQQIVREGLAASFIENNERSQLNTAQRIWTIRRHQGEESKQIALCMTNLSHDCYENIFPMQDTMKKENDQVCSLLATIDEQCE
jgi:hypothetical protein